MAKLFTSRKRIVFSILASIALLLSLIGVVAGFSSNVTSILKNLSTDYIKNTSEQMALAINREITNNVEFAKLLSYSVQRLNGVSQEEVDAFLEDFNSMGYFDDIALISLEGTSYSLKYGLSNVAHRNYFQQIMSDGTTGIVSETIKDVYNDEYCNVYASPIIIDGKIDGLFAGKLSHATFSDILDDNANNDMYINVVASTDGTVIITNDKTNTIHQDDNIFNITNIDSSMHSNFSLDDVSGFIQLEMNEEEYFCSYKSVGNNNMVVFTFILAGYFNNLTKQIVTTTLGFGFLLALIIILLFVYMMYSTYRSMQKIKKYSLECEKLAYVDPITGFATWNKYEREAPKLIANPSFKYAEIDIDIEKFKIINDFLGHSSGNKILCHLANIINNNLDDKSIFCRNTADNFSILFAYNKKQEIIDFLNNIINDVDYQITEIRVVLKIGVYLIKDKELSCRAFSDRAFLAKSTIKNANSSTYAFFDELMLERIRSEKAIEDVMEEALERKEFCVYLQPKIDMNDGKLSGAEALVRWNHDGVMMSPASFIPLFEKNHFVKKIDLFVFEEVCKLQKIWINKDYDPVVISVNMSRLHFMDSNFVESLVALCDKYEVPTKYLEIEITETAAFENLEVLKSVFAKLKESGFKVSIDDFGTGYSSLNMLKDLPVDVLKIDRTFLLGSETNNRAIDVIGHVISLGSDLKMTTVCEGIETKEQVDLLRRLGCDMAQGFYFARPMAVSDYEKLMYNANGTTRNII